jgi:hypothetical protein
MNILQLYQDYSVNYLTEGHKHCREGWVNTPCPFCTGNPGYHLSYNLENNYYLCWRCGWHPIIPTISTLINVTEKEAKKIIRQYGLLLSLPKKEDVTITKVVEHRLPSGVGPLGKNHKAYLENRGFDPDKLERMWNLLGTGPVSVLDGINYRHRIVIPFIWDNKQVSFDSRDITGKHMAKYMACPKERELIPHKEILYGRQNKWRETGILVEGPTDVWRLGTSSFAVSGIKYTSTQVRCASRLFRRIAVCFDDDPQAKIQAAKIVAELKFRGVDAFKVDIVGDPGGMKQSDADYLIKQLIK